MFSEPQKIIDNCGILPGMDIADLGSGSGHYTIGAAKALMATGRVYSVDTQKDLLTKLKNEAVRQNLHNVEVIWGDIEKPNGTKLRDSSIDLVLLCNILFQLEDKSNVIIEIKRILKPGGRVLVVDWEESFGGIGPAPKDVIKKDVVKEKFAKSGFHLDKEIQSGAHHYGLLFKKL